MEEIYAQLKIFVGSIGAVIAAFVGIMTRHIYHEEGFKWGRVATETPLAIFAGILAHGLGDVLGLNDAAVIAAASAFAYLTPQVIFPLILSAFRKRHGIDESERDGRGGS